MYLYLTRAIYPLSEHPEIGDLTLCEVKVRSLSRVRSDPTVMFTFSLRLHGANTKPNQEWQTGH